MADQQNFSLSFSYCVGHQTKTTACNLSIIMLTVGLYLHLSYAAGRSSRECSPARVPQRSLTVHFVGVDSENGNSLPESLMLCIYASPFEALL